MSLQSTDAAEPPGSDGLKALSFPEDEYRDRVGAVQKRMAQQGLGGMLLHSLSSICYLTGYESLYQPKYYMALVPAEGPPALLIQDFEMHNASVTAWTDDRTGYGLTKDPIQATAGFLHDRGLADARLAIEEAARILSPRDCRRLCESLPGVAWQDAGEILREVRLIKSPAEIDMIRRAGHATSAGIRAALAAAAVGKTDNDMAAAACEAVLSAGSEYMCIDPIVTVGRRSGIPHTSHRRVIIREGDGILVEIGACIHRYTGVMMRAAVAGSPSDKIKRMAAACARSVDALIENIVPGVPACEVAARARNALGREGDEFLWHGIYAYSIGLSYPPCWSDVDWCITPDNTGLLRPGMVFHANTSLRDVGHCGVALGETVRVTEDGCEVMTDNTRKLAVI